MGRILGNRFRRPKLWSQVGVAVVAVALAASAHATVIYVDDDAKSGGNGTSWNKAYKSLKSALRKAKAGDEIRIAQGVYKPAGAGKSRSKTFKIPSGVIVQGGFAGVTASNPNELRPSKFRTILSGDLNGDDGGSFSNVEDNVYHVVRLKNASADTQLRGLTITAGNADNIDFDSRHSHGGGALCLGDSSPTFSDCVIERNRAAWSGAGIEAGLSGEGSITLIDCTVRDNEAFMSSGFGAGVNMHAGFIDHCAFRNNDGGIASTGGGGVNAVTAIIENSVFKKNGSGGLFIGHDSVVRNCLFENNVAEDGGGVCIASGAKNVVISECDFFENASSSFGGALFSHFESASTIVNCRFFGNQSSSGHALCNRAQMTVVNSLFGGNDFFFGTAAISNLEGHLALVNCTIANNQNDGDGAGVYADAGTVDVMNCILWGNGAFEPATLSQQAAVGGDGAASMMISHSCVQGWSDGAGGAAIDGGGNTGANPDFVDAAGPDGVLGTEDDDLRLQQGSPCRDEADLGLLPADAADVDHDGDYGEPTPLDLHGNPRLVGTGLDMGAIEGQ